MENRKLDRTLYSRDGMSERMRLSLVNDFTSLISNSSIRYSEKFDKFYIIPLRYSGLHIDKYIIL